MYLNNIFIENMGSIEKFQLLEKDIFKEGGIPKPIILLGQNGSGKTTLLSCISDSFFELGNKTFNHILPNDGNGYKYYKVSGGGNTRIGANYSFSYLQFKKEGDTYEYIDKNGDLNFKDCKEKTNNLLTLQNNWKENGNVKESSNVTDNENFKSDFGNNTYCIFPANRFEYPYWMIRDSYNKITNIKDSKKYNGDLGKSILINDSMDDIKSWILDLFLDAKFRLRNNDNGGYDFDDSKNPKDLFVLNQGIENIENLLSEILNKNVKLSINYRGQGSRINIIDKKTNKLFLNSLDNLSTGESLLLCMFSTIIRSSDIGNISKSYKLEDIEGIVVIDEIDLHLHIRLQKEILPKLIRLFPKVQFIISTHSPFFLYGMNKEFGNECLMLNMPLGFPISYDNFKEFGEAYEVFKDLTQDYQEKFYQLKQEIENKNRDLVVCEGKTDVIHIKKAIEKLGITDLDNIDFLNIPEKGWGDNQLKNFLMEQSRTPHQYKIIGIFDRDVPETINLVGDFKNYKNNVYAFCIPKPVGKEKYNNISIEFYYNDKDLKKGEGGKHLFFDNELYFDRKGNPIPRPAPITDDFDKKIYDKNIGNIQGILSKSKFAELVNTDQDFIKDFDFSNFNLIIDKIREILKINEE